MKRPFGLWFLAFAMVAAAPPAIRVLSWLKPYKQPLDAEMVREGTTLFNHEWTPGDPLAAGGDGLGPVFNARSCLACHHQGGPGGSGGLEHNVTTFMVVPTTPGSPVREGVVHAFGTKYQETLEDVDPRLPRRARPTLANLLALPGSRTSPLMFPQGVHLSQRNTPALFGDNLIDAIPDRAIIANERTQKLKWGMAAADGDKAPVGRALRLPDGHIGRFGWKGQSPSLTAFVRAACANELGLANPGQPQPVPLGKPTYQSPGMDLTGEQCDQLTAFVASLARPTERLPESQQEREAALSGIQLFQSMGCADCHTADVGPVTGIYSDLLLHRMGELLVGGGSYGQPNPPPLPDLPPVGDGPAAMEWRTPPLWGVADSGPYMHDGRAATLDDAIHLHAGQGLNAANKYASLNPVQKSQLIAFLNTLRAP